MAQILVRVLCLVAEERQALLLMIPFKLHKEQRERAGNKGRQRVMGGVVKKRECQGTILFLLALLSFIGLS